MRSFIDFRVSESSLKDLVSFDCWIKRKIQAAIGKPTELISETNKLIISSIVWASFLLYGTTLLNINEKELHVNSSFPLGVFTSEKF